MCTERTVVVFALQPCFPILVKWPPPSIMSFCFALVWAECVAFISQKKAKKGHPGGRKFYCSLSQSKSAGSNGFFAAITKPLFTAYKLSPKRGNFRPEKWIVFLWLGFNYWFRSFIVVEYLLLIKTFLPVFYPALFLRLGLLWGHNFGFLNIIYSRYNRGSALFIAARHLCKYTEYLLRKK